MTDDLGTFYEALLFIAERPLDTDELAKLGEVPRLQAEAALMELAEYLAVSVREALLAQPDPTAVLRYTELAPYDDQVIENCLAWLGEREHPAKALLKGRLAAGRRG